MTSRPGIAPLPRLYLLTSPVRDPAALSENLAETVRAVDIAAVLLQRPATDERSLINVIKAIAPAVQGAGLALTQAAARGLPDILTNHLVSWTSKR